MKYKITRERQLPGRKIGYSLIVEYGPNNYSHEVIEMPDDQDTKRYIRDKLWEWKPSREERQASTVARKERRDEYGKADRDDVNAD